MTVRSNAIVFTAVLFFVPALSGCSRDHIAIPLVTSNAPAQGTQPSAARSPQAVGVTRRSHFLGAFFRPQGSPPYGVFEPSSPRIRPKPYPTPGPILRGPDGYCNRIAANGMSIASSYVVDPTKLMNLVSLGVGWTRMGAPQFTDDFSHLLGPGNYNFTDFDSAQCASLVEHGIRPVVNLAAGPVEYNVVPGTFSPSSYPLYKTAQDFGEWCGAVAAHEKAVFGVEKFSSPGNEVNTNESLYPGGEPQIAAYAKACYAAVKSANPHAFVYGFELNMDGGVDAPGFVARMYALGCGVGTCYDGIAMHLALRYPTPPGNPPCYPQPHGDYTVLCINAIQAAAQSKVHVLISESVYPVTAAVPDEQTKALAVASEFTALSSHSSVDGVSYANVDECALYPTGFWSGACLIDISGQLLPAYNVLQSIALANFQ